MTMSMQQIFTKVSKHLIKQGEPSMTGYQCLYRSPAGLSCAVGCLIPDADYRKRLEGCSTTDDRVMEALHSVIGVDPASRINKLALLADLQEVHDDYQPNAWPKKLAQVRHAYNLG
jgi:hypothetical protein